jgi:predicted lysophospholipase L1 biosynthesis ABC-type transport system permease subunit
VSLQVIPPPRLIEGGADAGNALAGTSRLTGEIAAELRGWIGFDGVEVSPAPGGIDLRYVLTPQRRARIRAPQPTDTAPPRVLVTPRLAELAGGVGGILPVQIGGARVSVTVAGVVDRFPGAAGQLVVGDRSALRTAVNAVAAGAARENEVWLDVPDARASAVKAALARPPLRALSATTRRELEADARRDPLARGTLLALGAAAVMALLLAAAGLALAVRSDLRDERGDLYDLEAQGASPSLLRRVVRLRALALSIAGLAAGAVVGAALVMLVTRMVAVTARGGAAEPPLAPSLDPAVIAVGGAAYIALALLLVGATTRRAFANARGPTFRDVE